MNSTAEERYHDRNTIGLIMRERSDLNMLGQSFAVKLVNKKEKRHPMRLPILVTARSSADLFELDPMELPCASLVSVFPPMELHPLCRCCLLSALDTNTKLVPNAISIVLSYCAEIMDPLEALREHALGAMAFSIEDLVKTAKGIFEDFLRSDDMQQSRFELEGLKSTALSLIGVAPEQATGKEEHKAFRDWATRTGKKGFPSPRIGGAVVRAALEAALDRRSGIDNAMKSLWALLAEDVVSSDDVQAGFDAILAPEVILDLELDCPVAFSVLGTAVGCFLVSIQLWPTYLVGPALSNSALSGKSLRLVGPALQFLIDHVGKKEALNMVRTAELRVASVRELGTMAQFEALPRDVKTMLSSIEGTFSL